MTSVFWTCNTFENNFEIKQILIKYLMESCCIGYDIQFNTKIFQNKSSLKDITNNRSGYFWALPLNFQIKLGVRSRAALTTHELEWLEPCAKLSELELKCSNRELIYVGNTNVTQST